MNLRSRYLARLVAVVPAVAAATLLSLSPALATPSAPHAARPAVAVVGVAAQQAAEYPPVRIESATIASTPSCSTVRSELPRLARAGLTRVACASPASSDVSPGCLVCLSKPSKLAAAASRTCVAGAVVRTRRAACAITAINYLVIEVPGGEVLGTGTIAVGYKETLDAKSRAWPLVASLELAGRDRGRHRRHHGHDGDRVLRRLCLLRGVRQPLAEHEIYTHTFTIDSAGAAINVTDQVPAVEIVAPAATQQASPVRLTTLGPARCDSDPLLKQFGKITSGCIFKDVAASYDVYLKGHGEDQVARNVEVGERTRSLHFGWYGHGRVLLRAPPHVQAKNRTAACGKTDYKKPYSCDEYPFAATYQGAFYFPSQNVTMKVLGTENSAEGGLRSAMYVSQRLLYGDSYWVLVLP